MKKVILGLIFAAAVVGIGIYSAIDLGEKSPVYASGKIVLPSEHAKAALGIKTLYLVVYDLDSPMPMPYGAVKFRLEDPINSGPFFDFAITKEKIIVMGAAMGGGEKPLPKRMRIKARLDKDGNAGPDRPGDISGQVAEIPFGKSDVVITLDTVIPTS